MNDIQSLLNLPLATLVVLAAGYASYKIAFRGKDKKHRAMDISLISLSFGLITKLVFDGLIGCNIWPAVSSVLACIFTLLVAVFWRWTGEDTLNRVLRKLAISNSDGALGAWDTIREATQFKPTQLIVRKSNGQQLMCDNLANYETFPHGPCLFGEDGSVALYVSGFRKSELEEWQENDPSNKDYGSALTYLCADEIGEIEIRYLA